MTEHKGIKLRARRLFSYTSTNSEISGEGSSRWSEPETVDYVESYAFLGFRIKVKRNIN